MTARLLVPTMIFSGLLIRFYFVIQSPILPLNDGGLFYTMANELIANNYQIPKYTSYNHLNIPFVYPPFGIWLLAVTHQISNIDMFTIQKFLPPLFSGLTLIPFYFLSKYLLGPNLSKIALLFISLSPTAFEWQIMGGGITRSTGTFFAITFLSFFANNLNRNILAYSTIISSILFTLTTLSHPEWFLFALISSIILFFNKQSLVKLIKIYLISLIIAAPWWTKILNFHGVIVFLNSSNNVLKPNPPSVILIYLPMYFGFLKALLNRSKFCLWLCSFYIIGFRLILNITSPIIAVLYGYSITFTNRFWRGFLSVFAVLSIFLQLSFGYTIFQNYKISQISNNDLQSIDWIKTSTPKSARFLILSTQPDTYSSGYEQLAEWFPSLSDRVSILTYQGSEWLSEKREFIYKNTYNQIFTCYDCIFSLSFDYIYIRDDLITTSIITFLNKSNKVHIAYSNPQVKIFKKI